MTNLLKKNSVLAQIFTKLWSIYELHNYIILIIILKGTDQAGTFISLKCVVYNANYRIWHQSSKIQVVS